MRGKLGGGGEARQVHMGLSLTTLNDLDRDGFVTALGGVFEHSPWVTATAWPARPFADVDALHSAMVAAVDAAADGRSLPCCAPTPTSPARRRGPER